MINTGTAGLRSNADYKDPERRLLTAAEVAMRAKMQLAGITGLDADHVSSVEKRELGWLVTVDLIELRRIPAATDVLAAYEAELDDYGTLVGYHRNRRYFRDQTLEGR
jgi:hypothetical protein